MYEEILKEIGLTEAESKVYLSLLELGSTTTTEIIKKSGLHKSTTYETLERLIKKGLVSFVIKENKKFFQAANPRKLLDIIQEREDSIKNILPELELKSRQNKKEQETIVYEGKEGLKTLLEDFLEIGKDVYIIGGTIKMSQMLQFFLPHFDKKLIKQKITLHFTYNEDSRKRGLELKSKSFIKLRFIPKEFISPVSVAIYGNKSAIIRFKEKPIIILIENRETAKSFMNYFQLLWKIAKK